jgi:hypothetical protein
VSGDVEVTGVPQPVARRLRDLLEVAGGLSVDAVIADAEDEGSPLHHLFEWDDTAAAEKFRHVQARALIGRVRVTVITAEDKEPVRVRAYVSRQEIGQAGESLPAGTYLPIEDVAGATDREAALLRALRRDIARLRAKYRGYEALIAAEIVA